SIHPIIQTINDIKKFFSRLGFIIVYGPEIEDEYHNFDALNISKNHPSRDSHDTFWFDSKRLLRTQTSSMQIRVMKKEKPPIRLLVPGKVYRNDYDSTHTPMFHQIEGLIVDKNINFSNLKWIIDCFLQYFFDKKISIRFRPSYFPFTVLSAEVDILDAHGKFLEILGCGMVHPKILHNININAHVYSACAFGIGIERITMLRYGIL
ncbi:phenylalanine--tRNA ligase subunit alpha, partial [Buchnera aphidicola]|nr:phenylalanine--tRNA ligase subunit alpha [Buchnera aphidicola]